MVRLCSGPARTGTSGMYVIRASARSECVRKPYGIRRLILRHAPSDTAVETQARSGPAPETLRRITERNSVVMTAALGERPYKGKLAVARNARTGERSH